MNPCSWRSNRKNKNQDLIFIAYFFLVYKIIGIQHILAEYLLSLQFVCPASVLVIF